MRPARGLVVGVVILAASLLGCSVGVADAPVAGERIAGSLTELFEKALDMLHPLQVEREALERAVRTGRIAPEDYEAAHLRFVQCMTQHGFQPAYRKTPEGLYIELSYSHVKDEEALKAANMKCAQDTAVLESLYRTQQANPDLLADKRLVAIRCLKKGGFVDAAYTVERFDEDYKTDDFPFNADEDGPNNCLAEAGYGYFTVSQ